MPVHLRALEHVKWKHLISTLVMAIEREGGPAQDGGRWPALKDSRLTSVVVSGGAWWGHVGCHHRPRFRQTA